MFFFFSCRHIGIFKWILRQQFDKTEKKKEINMPVKEEEHE